MSVRDYTKNCSYKMIDLTDNFYKLEDLLVLVSNFYVYYLARPRYGPGRHRRGHGWQGEEGLQHWGCEGRAPCCQDPENYLDKPMLKLMCVA